MDWIHAVVALVLFPWALLMCAAALVATIALVASGWLMLYMFVIDVYKTFIKS